MKETRFIEQNKEKWSRFEKLYADSSREPEELSDLYMDLTDDLSYAQTFYKRRTVRVYLNRLAQLVYSGVHKQKSDSVKKFITVWRTSLPLEIYRSRYNLLLALVAFLIYSLIGVITTHFNPDFPRIVMGDGYVNMTLDNIRNGNPLAVYETTDQTAMFIQITTNNLKVAFLTFFAGFFFTFGTHILLFSNGVMLGSFQYFFHLKGLLITSFLGIWIHGAFEISAIVLAGGAGITAGNGWLFPGSYSRLQSLQLSVKRGLKIMMSLVPFIIAAGFLESYVTHNYQHLPDWSKWTLILFSFGIILFLYVIYPLYIARKYPHLVDQEETALFSEKVKVQLYKIRTIGNVFADSFQVYRQTIGTTLRLISITSLPFILTILFFQSTNHADKMAYQHYYDWVEQLRILFGYSFENLQDVIIVMIWSILISHIFLTTFWTVQNLSTTTTLSLYFSYLIKRLPAVWLGTMILFLLVFALPWYWLIWVTFLLPFFYIQPATMALDDASFANRFKRSFSFSSSNYGISLMVLLLTIFIVFIVAQPFAFVFSIHEPFNDKPLVRDLLDMIADFTKRIALIYTTEHLFWSNIVRQLFYIGLILLILPFIAVTMSLIFYSEKEKREVVTLRKGFARFGKRSRLQETPQDLD